MKAVHVLGRIDRRDDLLRVDLRRQRQLHQDAVHRRSALSSRDQRRAIRLRSTLCRQIADRTSACRLRSPPLICCGHRLRSPDSRRPERPPVPARCRGRGAGVHRIGHLAAQVGRNRFAVDDARGHGQLLALFAAIFSSAAISVAPSPAMVSRLTRARSPGGERHVARRDASTALAISRISAALASPSLGAARTRALSTAAAVGQGLDAVDCSRGRLWASAERQA